MLKLTPHSLRRLSLLLSLTANVGLGGIVIEHFTSHSPAEQARPTPTAAPVASTDRSPASFRWSQVESADVGVYAQNLRAIGCPEETIRHIVEADVAELFTRREQELAAQIPPGQQNTPAYAQRLQNLHQEQAAFLKSILPPSGATTSSSTAAAATTHYSASAANNGPITGSYGSNSVSPSPGATQSTGPDGTGSLLGITGSPSMNRAITNGDRPSVYPAALVAGDGGTPLNEGQQAALNQMQNDFNDSVGDSAQNPADSAYRQRWQNAQWLADQRYRALYGADAFAAMQKKAYLQSLTDSGQIQP